MAAFQQYIVCNQILVQLVVPSVEQHHYRRIINIISTSVKMSTPGLGFYNTIRGAEASWSKTLSMEVGPFGITVNNVLPGPIQTTRLDSIIEDKVEKSKNTHEEVRQEMISGIPAGRFWQPQFPALAVAFLTSPVAAYINGLNLTVDGEKLVAYKKGSKVCPSFFLLAYKSLKSPLHPLVLPRTQLTLAHWFPC